jgi:hypothetical protein
MPFFADWNNIGLAIVFAVVFLSGMIGLTAMSFFGYRTLASRSLRRKFNGLTIHFVPEAGDVRITYYTYHGFVAWFSQTEHRLTLPPPDARILLGRLLRFNLTWGLWAAGSPLLLPLAVANYFVQRRSVSRQETANAITAAQVVGFEISIKPIEAAPTTAIQSDSPPVLLRSNDDNRDQIRGGGPHETGGRHEAIKPNAPPRSLGSTEEPAANIQLQAPPARSIILQIFGYVAFGLCVMISIMMVVGLVQGQFDLAISGLIIVATLGGAARDWLGKSHDVP